MADHLHHAFTQFRETMLTAIARLEFQIRDSLSFEEEMKGLQKRVEAMEASFCASAPPRKIPSANESVREDESDSFAVELIKMEQSRETRNILVPSVRSTPALAAAVAAASALPPDLNLEDAETITTMDAEEPNLQSIVIDGKTYAMDSELNVYQETDEGYEQIGTYQSLTHSILPLEESNTDTDTEIEPPLPVVEGEVEEEEEEQSDLEQFTWKGNTYYRDSENLVYQETDEGYEQIGTWNGKRIVLDE